MLSRRKAMLALAALAVGLAVVAFFARKIPQPLSYHNFADKRWLLGIPNFGDVVSNLAFLLAGLRGLWFCWQTRSEARMFHHPRERWPWMLFFFGMSLVAFGSAYYHLGPDNARLVWDRLPMTVAFMALVSAVICERISVRLGLWLLPVLLLVGLASVLQWYASELRQEGDVRFYLAVQVYSVLALLVILSAPTRYTRSADLAVVVGLYILAKVLEAADAKVFALGHVVSGHTLKHLASAAAGFWVLRMLEKRKPLKMDNESVSQAAA